MANVRMDTTFLEMEIIVSFFLFFFATENEGIAFSKPSNQELCVFKLELLYNFQFYHFENSLSVGRTAVTKCLPLTC